MIFKNFTFIALATSCFFLYNQSAFSTNMKKDIIYYNNTNHRLFVLLGSGGSFSRNSDISVNLQQWDPAVQGYNARLNNSVLYTAGIGYQLSCLMSIDFEITSRPSYSYNKFQSPVPGSSTPGFLGSKTRKFDLKNVSALINVFLHGSGLNLFYDVGHATIIEPFIGGGLGLSYHILDNFHSVLVTSPVPGSNNVSSIMNANTTSTFAWQLLIGLALVNNCQWGVDVGYRYFNGGKFESNNYLINVPSGLTQPLTVSPWKGTLTADEVFLDLKYYF